MATAQSGDTVRLHYTGRLRDGSVFDTSEGGDPLAFTLGTGDVIPGFDRGVTGMEEGEEKTIEIPAEEAYGARRDDLLVSVSRDQFPDGLSPEVGQQLQVGMADGNALDVVVAEVGAETITLDANHPLAGADLVFDIALVEVQKG
ncbi:MAG: peptidylprolyl isomerase [Rubricoccaceae bacterium]|nr:peptidylprolyl isomerase [Rubricoccaceae bacterium]